MTAQIAGRTSRTGNHPSEFAEASLFAKAHRGDPMTNLSRLTAFVTDALRIIESGSDEAAILADLTPKLEALVDRDDWLPDAYAVADGRAYRQYLLYADPLDRLSVVSFVWGPGQGTPIHDHRVWGLVGVLRGEEISVSYEHQDDGSLRAGPAVRLAQGAVAAVSPAIGDIHAITNGLSDAPSISIHVYGGNIGRVRRSVFDARTGATHEFISGYSNEALPNLWQSIEPTYPLKPDSRPMQVRIRFTPKLATLTSLS